MANDAGTNCGCDLPTGVLGEVTREGSVAHQLIMNESKNNIVFVGGLVRGMQAKKFDEVGSMESSAVRKVLDKLP